MSEQTPAPATGNEAPTTIPAEASVEEPKPTETVDFWKQKAREQEGRAKANAEAAKRLAEIEDAQKSEAQKNADALTAAQRAAEESKAEALRYRAAATHKVSEDYFDLLGTGDADAISDRARRVGELVSAKAENEQLRAEIAALREGKPAPTQSRPVADLKPGATPESDSDESEQLYRSLFPQG